MKLLNTENITDLAQYRLKAGTFDFLQTAEREDITSLVISMVGDSYNRNKCYILYGCVQSGTYPNYSFSAGAIFKRNEVFQVDAVSLVMTGSNVPILDLEVTNDVYDPVIFTDNSTRNIHNIRKLVVTQGLTSTTAYGDFSNAINIVLAHKSEVDAALISANDYTDTKIGIVNGFNPTNVITRFINIGAWNMQSVSNLLFDLDPTLAIGLDIPKIVSISVIIRNDAQDKIYPLDGFYGGFLNGFWFYQDGTYINMQKGGSSSIFNTAAFSSTSVNRGVIKIQYIA